jgi:methionyl-tRNA formyltransferase
MGTPAFAVPCLEALFDVADVVLVVCQPDKPQGRGLKLSPPPTKLLAEARGVPVFQPDKARDGRLREAVLEARADFALVVAYGKILPQDVLDAPRLGCLNVHGSLLPRWRGAAPIQWAVLSGDAQSGVCLMQMDAGMDTGPELARRSVVIEPNETYGELSDRLAQLSGELLRTELPRFVRGELEPVPQPEAGVTHARMLQKADGALDFAQSAQAVHDRVRGLSPWPGAYTQIDGRRLKVHTTRVQNGVEQSAEPGTVLTANSEGIDVACEPGVVRLVEMQLEGKKRMTAEALLAGFAILPGWRFAARNALVLEEVVS